jgi:tetratricopeptide (TPR) repeat protein
MDLHTVIHENQADIALGENVIPICELAKGLEEAGEFDSAADALRPFWSGPLSRPYTSSLDEYTKAELLLRAGTLTGWLGSARQLPGSQETAKDLISESAAIFEDLKLTEKVAEAHVDLAICYWREGALDEARVTLRHVIENFIEPHSEQRLRALLNSAIVEKVATREREALKIYRDAYALFDASTNHALKGKFHNSHATLLRSLGSSENREEYIDSALVEYAAASYHFEQAGHRRFQARVENNLGFLYGTLGRFSDAHHRLNNARSLHLSVGDHGGAAGADDTRAQVLLMEEKYEHAEKAARSAVRSLSTGDEHAILAEALTTHGIALARLRQFRSAKSSLDKAVDIAEIAGNPYRAGIAAVAAIEELCNYVPLEVLKKYYATADSCLCNSDNRNVLTRLGQCARRILVAELISHKPTIGMSTTPPVQPGFSLDAEVLRYEGSLIRKALEDSGGSVTKAARLLGVTHQGLAFILNGRHSDLLSIRTPVKKRRRSIIRNQ